jgi:hypothetical protein
MLPLVLMRFAGAGAGCMGYHFAFGFENGFYTYADDTTSMVGA